MKSIDKSALCAAILILATQTIRASCGLHFCPRTDEVTEKPFEAALSWRQSGFDLNDHGGQYSEFVPTLQFAYKNLWLLKANIPFAGLSVKGETEWGMENPMLLAEWRFHPGMGNMLSLGVQAELPFGDHHHGLAGDHFMLVPYAAFGMGLGPWFLTATAGYSAAIGHHDHEEPPTAADLDYLYVHPHEDQEILYRLSAGLPLWNGRTRPEAFLNAQYVLVEDKEFLKDDHALTAGILFPIKIGGGLTTAAAAEFPLIRPGRFDWSAGLDLRLAF